MEEERRVMAGPLCLTSSESGGKSGQAGRARNFNNWGEEPNKKGDERLGGRGCEGPGGEESLRNARNSAEPQARWSVMPFFGGKKASDKGAGKTGGEGNSKGSISLSSFSQTHYGETF